MSTLRGGGGGYAHHILVPIAYKNPSKKGGKFEKHREKLESRRRGVNFFAFFLNQGHGKSQVPPFFLISRIDILASVRSQ